jgi:hypothetical protein
MFKIPEPAVTAVRHQRKYGSCNELAFVIGQGYMKKKMQPTVASFIRFILPGMEVFSSIKSLNSHSVFLA